MRAWHDSRRADYRVPFGAVPAGTPVRLSLDLWDAPDVLCRCRLWSEEGGEVLLPMEGRAMEDRVRFSCTVDTPSPGLLWYSFLLTGPDGRVLRLGAREGRTGGAGCLYDREPPSFQLTVYTPRALPDWYREAVVYQVFPDRFRRGKDWEDLARKALAEPGPGPVRRLCPDWDLPPSYERDGEGRIAAWDFYGGTLSGLREKLPYLRDLGVTVIALTPIFRAASSHRYDVGDYEAVDPMLGDDQAFETLAREAKAAGISLVLDGVFSHTGWDSRYFDRFDTQGGTGAFPNPDSPYRSWYRFHENGYDCRWGMEDLPELNTDDPGLRDYLFRGPRSVVRKWLAAGAGGWRLDMAEALPDDFIRACKDAVTDALGPEGLLLGEVWEDASRAVSSRGLRRYLLGKELDGVTNGPLREGLIAFLLGRQSAQDLAETLNALREGYPDLSGCLNLLGGPDAPRLLTVLGEAPDPGSLEESRRRTWRLSPDRRALAKRRAWLAILVQMTLPGAPCIYYGDEAGAEGFGDPYNRGTFPWGGEDLDMETMTRNAIELRRLYPAFTRGDLTPCAWNEDVFGFTRAWEGETCVVAVNRSPDRVHTISLPALGDRAMDLTEDRPLPTGEDGTRALTLRPLDAAVVVFRQGTEGRLGAAMPRGSGVLCHITSLPNPEGRGNIGAPARAFVDFLAEAGQKYWQILPLNPTDSFGSPYAGASAFAADPDLLPEDEAALRQAFAAFEGDQAYDTFVRENRPWLEPYALYTALKAKYRGAPWQAWPPEDRAYPPASGGDGEVRPEAAFQMFCQYRFHVLWTELRAYARERGVAIIGDLPMYVAADSADAWCEREMFTLGEDGWPSACAGVPPDYFSRDGQFWGNPLYHWERMARDGYDWWMRRFRRVFDLCDWVRLDHFRGFASYWSIPAGGRAADGTWRFGPARALFEAAGERFGPLPVLAEDLGSLTPAVRGLVERCGFPGTDVAQFSDTDPLTDYLPPLGKVAYTGTHDNQTLLGWCRERYTQTDPEQAARIILRNVMESRAEVVILPLQDVLGLGDEARMNTPGTVENNWTWQAREEDMEGAAARLLALTKETDRS